MLSTPKIPTGVQEAKTYSDATSPYEKAVLETVTRTGQPRTEWEHIIGHPLVLETDARARQLAGIREELREHHAPRKLYRRAAKPYIAD